MIAKLLIDHIEQKALDHEVAVLLSGGVDSISVAFAAHLAFKNITCYSFQLDNNPSYDYAKAEEICKIMNWDFVGVNIPTKNLEKDFFTKKTNIGIHNDDYIFEMDKKLIKRVGSQGQQKTFIIALRIAEFKILNERLQTVPIMLLDDVFHKLDDKKIDLLLDYLKENDFNQIIISDSIKNRLKKIEKKIKEIKIFKIVSGNVYER